MASSYQEALQSRGIAAASSMPAAAAATASPEPVSYEEALASRKLAPSKTVNEFGDERPIYASGKDPFTPVNESPLSVSDRLAMSLGDEKGKLEFLQKHFGEARRTKNGDFIVKDRKDNLWKRVDPEGNSGDPWEFTKDVVETLPTVGAIAASLGAGFATGGASLLAQAAAAGGVAAATSGLSTSMGRLAGTYGGSVEDQAADAGFEALLNAGGVFIAPGAKLAKEALGPTLTKAGLSLGKLGDKALSGLKQVMNFASRVPIDDMDNLIARPVEVGKRVTEIQAGRMPEQAIAYAKESMIPKVKLMADDIVQSVSSVYDAGRRQLPFLFDNAHEIADVDKLASRTAQVFEENGLGKYVSSPTVSDKLIGRAGEAKFQWLSPEDAWKKLEESGKMPTGLGLDKGRVLGLLRKVQDNFESMSRAQIVRGRKGVETMLGLHDEMRTIMRQLHGVAEKTENPALTGLAKQLESATADIFERGLTTKTPVSVANILGSADDQLLKDLGIEATTTQPLRALNTFYQQADDMLIPIKGALDSNQGSAAVEQLMQRLTSTSTAKVAQRSGFERILRVLNNASQGNASIKPIMSRVNNITQELLDTRAAMSFTPWARPGLVSQQAATASIAGLALGRPELAASLAAGGAATSPRLQYTALKGLTKAKDFLSSLGSNGIARAQQADPNFINKIMQTVLETPEIYSATRNSLVQGGVQAIQGQRANSGQ